MHIDGSDNRVAQRDYIESAEIYVADFRVHEPRRPTGPNLVPCTDCGLSGLSPTATECPACRCPLALNRALERRRLRRAAHVRRLHVIASILRVVAPVLVLASFLLPDGVPAISLAALGLVLALFGFRAGLAAYAQTIRLQGDEAQ